MEKNVNGKMDIQKKERPRLHGWNYEKLSCCTKGKEICVSDIPELMAQLAEMCSKYVESRK